MGAIRRRMLPIVLRLVFQNAVYLPLDVEPRQATPLHPSLLTLSAIGLHLPAVKLGHRARGERVRRFGSENLMEASRNHFSLRDAPW